MRTGRYLTLEGLTKIEQNEAFKVLDHRALAKMDDKELAAWHAEQSPESAQFILATHEWNRRLLAAELRSIRFATWAGILASLGGVALGVVLTKMLGE